MYITISLMCNYKKKFLRNEVQYEWNDGTFLHDF